MRAAALLLHGAASTNDGEPVVATPDGPPDAAADLESVIRGVAAGNRPEESLAAAWEEERDRTLVGLAPPRIDPGLRGQALSRALLDVNRAVGAAERITRKGGTVLERLASLPAHRAAASISRLDDPATLWCVVRSGRIAERRAAVRRLGDMLGSGALLASELDPRDVTEALGALRDPRIAFEVDLALAAVPGNPGRAARQRLARVDKLLARVAAEAAAFWSGDREGDPLEGLSREESLRLGVWLRRGGDELAAHVAERVRSLLASPDDGRLVDIVGAIVPSADERLVPGLVLVLADGGLEARIAAARALGRIADPRVRPALAKSMRHAKDPMERVVLGGALGQCGDASATEELVALLGDGHAGLGEEAARSLGAIGAARAAPRLAELLDSQRSPVVRAAARALIRCGSGTELDLLRRASARPSPHSNELADAAEALALRLQLLGRLPADDDPRPIRLTVATESRALAAADTAEPSLRTHVAALGYHLLGLFWSAVFQRSRALAAFETATRLHPRVVAAHLHKAALHIAADRDDLAVESFRRAIGVNRRWVLLRPTWVQGLMRSYLRRADLLVAKRRRREALALLDELASLDLRYADLDLRLAMTRRRDRLLVDRAHGGAAP